MSTYYHKRFQTTEWNVHLYGMQTSCRLSILPKTTYSWNPSLWSSADYKRGFKLLYEKKVQSCRAIMLRRFENALRRKKRYFFQNIPESAQMFTLDIMCEWSTTGDRTNQSEYNIMMFLNAEPVRWHPLPTKSNYGYPSDLQKTISKLSKKGSTLCWDI